MTIGLETLVTSNVEHSAEWRREVAIRYPADSRNLEAASLLDSLAADLPALEGSALHLQLSALWEGPQDMYAATEATLEYVKQIGFHVFPGSGAELLSDLIKITVQSTVSAAA